MPAPSGLKKNSFLYFKLREIYPLINNKLAGKKDSAIFPLDIFTK